MTSEVSVPTIGIGAGAGCDGQVLVCTDLLGLSRGPRPKFAKRFAELGDAAVAAFKTYVADVQKGEFPDADHSYKPNHVEEEKVAASGEGGVVVPFMR